MNKSSKLRSSFIVGGIAVLILLIITLIINLCIPMSHKLYALLVLAVFLCSSIWYYMHVEWENRLRRLTATSLYSVGVLLILKAVSSQYIQNATVGGQILLQDNGSPSLAISLLIAMSSTPWPWDIGIAIVGLLMLLGVDLFTKTLPGKFDHKDKAWGGTQNGGGININVVQVVGDQKGASVPVKFSPGAPSTSGASYRMLSTYDSDLPPLVDVWVGRDSEMSLLDGISSGVAAITGIGGQGKSSLAAKVLESRLQKHDIFWDWRDCRGEANRFRTHLVSVIEHYTKGAVSAAELADADVTWLTKFLFRKLGDKEAVVVFDNVDHYVDVYQSLFVSDISAFIGEALRVDHRALIVFTCRPRISYASPRFREVYLRGLTLDETNRLFALRIAGGISSDMLETIKRFHALTDGHPLWLNIIASQIGRQKDSAAVILKNLETGEVDERARAMLRGVWQSLNNSQHHILRAMAEFPRAMAAGGIYEYISHAFPSRKRFDRAFRGLKAISLVIEKGGLDSTEPRYDLHPMVTAFIRKEYGERGERNELLDALIVCCDNIVVRLRTKKNSLLSIEVLEQMTTKAELELSRGNVINSIRTLLDASDSLIARGLQDELFRLCEQIFRLTNWQSSEWIEDHSFDSLFHVVIKTMVEHGKTADIRTLLEKYTAATKSGTARYIGVCELNSYVEWFNDSHSKAIKWAERGITLKKRGNIDSSYDCEPKLALAWRDSGNIDGALKIILAGNDPDKLLHDDHLNNKRGASFYGNIGRCFQLKGESQKALILYAKSFDILERHDDSTSILNRGYAALWIGEVLLSLNKYCDARNFLRLAVLIWNQRAPLKVIIPENLLKKCCDGVPQSILSDDMLKEWCKEWIIDCLKT